MRRRITGNICTGLGNPSPVIFDNQWTDNEKFNETVKSFFEDALNSLNDEVIKNVGGFDCKIELENKNQIVCSKLNNEKTICSNKLELKLMTIPDILAKQPANNSK